MDTNSVLSILLRYVNGQYKKDTNICKNALRRNTLPEGIYSVASKIRLLQTDLCPRRKQGRPSLREHPPTWCPAPRRYRGRQPPHRRCTRKQCRHISSLQQNLHLFLLSVRHSKAQKQNWKYMPFQPDVIIARRLAGRKRIFCAAQTAVFYAQAQSRNASLSVTPNSPAMARRLSSEMV